MDLNYLSVNFGISPSPTPSPSPSPTASPEWYYEQDDAGWGGDEYNFASEWAEPGETGMERWGCAVTDAAMILKSYDVKEPGDGSEITPGELNAWLKGQPDGYLNGGLLNWVAVTRLAKESYDEGEAPTKLEFVRESGGEDQVGAQVGLGHRPVVNKAGHFVITYDEADVDNWMIADPQDPAVETLEKTTPLTSINTFVPSTTDLSYIVVAGPAETKIKLYNTHGQEVGESITEYLDDDVGEAESPHTKTLYYPKPESGQYKLKTDGPVDVYLYELDGKVKIKEDVQGSQWIRYDKDGSGEMEGESWHELVWRLYDAGGIKHRGKAYELDYWGKILEQIKYSWQGRMREALEKYLVRLIERYAGRSLTEETATELIEWLDTH